MSQQPNDDEPEAPPVAGDARRRPPSLVVGIGASAGGLAAFRSFLDNMPADTGMAFVLVQHLDPNSPSILPELLQPHTAMRVETARDKVRLAANHVFVILPNTTLTMQGDVLRVTTPAPPREFRRPIDTFFTSLAESQEDCAVGIILSGTGSDGSAGIKAVKAFGGFTLAQAQFDEHAMSGMPQSAASTGLVDVVESVEGLPAKLLEHQEHLARVENQKDADGVREDVKESLTAIIVLLRKRLKHDFSGYKQNTMIRRIQRRMQVLRIEAVSDYAEHLRREPSEGDALFRELLIGVTQFFRDEDAFETLKTEVLPPLLATRAADDPIRVWVAGCATGEEVYSIAIVLEEVLASQKSRVPVTIFGTDIDAKAIAVARAARYRRLDGLSAERLQRWFVKDGDSWCPVAAIRDLCIFSEHSLVKDPPFSKLDLVSCRNVLIYLDNELQQQLIQTFHYALRPGGYLFLGPSESVSRTTKSFGVAHKKHRILQRHDSVKSPLPDLPRTIFARNRRHAPASSVEDQIDKSARRVMARHSPAWFVIDRHHEVLRFSGGETGRYLEPSQGSANLNLFAILTKGLRSQVRHAVERAFSSGQTIVEENFAFGIGDRAFAGDLIVEPIVESGQSPDFAVVAFRERAQGAEAEAEKQTVPPQDTNVEALQRELRAWQARHQAASDELESQIENMKSVTEEFQSVNEELQSSNEELETSKEEMQSVNEELQTINGELHGKNDQLTQANNDLQNLLDSTHIATLFLDDDLRIRNFTPATMELFALREGDRGRPITDIVTMLSYDRLRDDVRKVQRTLEVVEHELDLKDESATFVMRMRPYRTRANVISGVVITFTNITERKQQADHLQILMKELQHRTNNLFTVIQAMARQTARHSADFTEFETYFAARIQGLSKSNLLLIDQDWKGVQLEALVQSQLAPFIGVETGRLEMDGPPAVMTAETVQTLGMALHELATNAAKYGALSSGEGKIVLNWRFEDDDNAPETFWLEWREQGGPIVKPAKRKGFGRFVTDQMITRGLNARIETDFAPSGLRWTIQMPPGYARRG